MEWISIKDKLPEDDQIILGWSDKREARLPLICWFDVGSNEFIPCFCDQECFVKIDYWMPLPEPPKDNV